jgi:hypothetical protein
VSTCSVGHASTTRASARRAASGVCCATRRPAGVAESRVRRRSYGSGRRCISRRVWSCCTMTLTELASRWTCAATSASDSGPGASATQRSTTSSAADTEGAPPGWARSRCRSCRSSANYGLELAGLREGDEACRVAWRIGRQRRVVLARTSGRTPRSVRSCRHMYDGAHMAFHRWSRSPPERDSHERSRARRRAARSAHGSGAGPLWPCGSREPTRRAARRRPGGCEWGAWAPTRVHTAHFFCYSPRPTLR